VSVELSERRTSSPGWLESAVFTLDRWLRSRNGIYEFTDDPQCLFRIDVAEADHSFALADGTLVHAGDPIVRLHLWNEHFPPMGRGGPSMAWARQVSRALHASLRALAQYLQQQSVLDDVVALAGEMHLASVEQSAQLARILARYGFEMLRDDEGERLSAVHRFGRWILIFLLVAATNPVALRSTVLRRYRRRVVLSRLALARRYRTPAAASALSAASPPSAPSP